MTFIACFGIPLDRITVAYLAADERFRHVEGSRKAVEEMAP